MQELFKQEIFLNNAIAFDVPEDTFAAIEFTPIAANVCCLQLDGGEELVFPSPEGRYVYERFLKKGEHRFVDRVWEAMGVGNGLLTVTRVPEGYCATLPTPGKVDVAHTEYKRSVGTGVQGYGRNVLDYGAKGDGITDDTQAIQAALDAGGPVFIPGGVYRTGTLHLRSNGGLSLASDAVLFALPGKEAYNAPDYCPQNPISINDKTDGRHLISAVECENVFLEGYGIIDGNRQAFFDPDVTGKKQNFTGTRPSFMIFFCECTGVRIRDLTLNNAAYWCCVLLGCRDITVDGLRIKTVPCNVWNGDGLAIDCCKNATVSNCIIWSADDSLTIRASYTDKLRKYTDGICENINVTNCTMMHGHCGIRVGVGEGTIRNCAFSNCTLKKNRIGIGIHSTYSEGKVESFDDIPGVDVENITFSNITMDACAPFFIRSNTGLAGALPKSNKHIRNITFNGIRGRTYMGAFLEGNLDSSIENVNISQYCMEMFGGDLIEPDALQREGVHYAFQLPYAIYAANIRNLSFCNSEILWDRHCSQKWLGDIRADNCADLKCVNCNFTAEK